VKAAALIALLTQLALPSGRLGVGRTNYHWTDRARGREIAVHIWHPVPFDARPWPVVVYSPGAGTPVTNYTAKLDDLASHGYVIVASDYPGEMPRCSPPAGAPYDEMVEIGMRCLRERADVVAADIRFVIDQLALINRPRSEPPDFEGRLDLRRLAAVGHSLGGFASVRACQLDGRITACVNEDGGTADGVFLHYAGASSPTQPFLYVEASVPTPSDQQLAANGITREDWNARLNRMVNVVHEQQLRSSGAGSYKVSLHAAGMVHGSFGDLYLTAATDEARRSALHNLLLCEEVTRAFLDKHLKGATATLLDDPGGRTEVVVKKY
jgi:dienelactone hydrolase